MHGTSLPGPPGDMVTQPPMSSGSPTSVLSGLAWLHFAAAAVADSLHTQTQDGVYAGIKRFGFKLIADGIDDTPAPTGAHLLIALGVQNCSVEVELKIAVRCL